MIVTVLWEDQRGVEERNFGPHELLVACLVDDLELNREHLRNRVFSVPKKGVGNVRAALRRDLHRLTHSGPVIAVVDRDKVIDLWKHGKRPSDCMTGITERLREEAAGDYDLVFLIRNMESLTDATYQALQQVPPAKKPTPDERDRLLMRVVWRGTPEIRSAIRQACPSFGRIVTRVAKALAS